MILAQLLQIQSWQELGLQGPRVPSSPGACGKAAPGSEAPVPWGASGGTTEQ